MTNKKRTSGVVKHGLTAYTKHRCRCKVCREARRVYVKNYRNDPANVPPPGDPRHGRRSTYVMRGCKCDLCRKAVRDYRNARHAALKQARDREREFEAL